MTISAPSCIVIPPPPALPTITMPGGLKLQGFPALTGGMITDLSAIQSLLNQMAPAMAALQPVFLIIDAIVKIMAIFNTIPGVVVGNVVDFFDSIKEAVEAVIALVQIAPAFSLPVMISGLIGNLATLLRALRSVVVDLQADTAKGNAIVAQATAEGDAALLDVGNCILAQSAAFQAHVLASLGPAGQLLEAATALVGMMPAPIELPSLGDASGLDLDALGDFLDNIATVLEAIQIPGA